MELPLLSPAASDTVPQPDEEEPEMDSVEKEEELDDSNRYRYPLLVSPVLRIRIRIRIHRIHMLLGLLDPDTDPSVRGMDPNPDPDPLVRGMDPRIQIRIHPQNVMDPQNCPLDVANVADPGSGVPIFNPWIRDRLKSRALRKKSWMIQTGTVLYRTPRCRNH